MVAATAVIEWVGDQRITAAGVSLTLVLVAVLLFVAGVVTLLSETRRLRPVRTAVTRGRA